MRYKGYCCVFIHFHFIDTNDNMYRQQKTEGAISKWEGYNFEF